MNTPSVRVSVSDSVKRQVSAMQVYGDAPLTPGNGRGVDFQASQCISMGSNLTLPLPLGLSLPLSADLCKKVRAVVF